MENYEKAFDIPDDALYDLFTYQAGFLAASLKKLIKKTNSIPSVFLCEKMEEHGLSILDNDKEHEQERILAQEEAKDTWRNILEAMWYSFDQIARDNPDDPQMKDDEYTEQKENEYQEKVQTGLDYYHQYFRHLWI